MNQKRVKQQYVPYWEWEDWVNGMWNKSKNEETDLQKAIAFTGNHELYGVWMRIVVRKWPRTMLHNLTNPSMNKRAFLGHCAVSLAIEVPEYITRMAWKELTDNQRLLADKQAQNTINHWYEEQNQSIHQNLGTSMLS